MPENNKPSTVLDWLEEYLRSVGQSGNKYDNYVMIRCLDEQHHANGSDERPSLMVHLGKGNTKCYGCHRRMTGDQLINRLREHLHVGWESPSMGDAQHAGVPRKTPFTQMEPKRMDPTTVKCDYRFVYRTPEGKAYGIVFRSEYDAPDGKVKKKITQASLRQGEWWWGMYRNAPNHFYHVELLSGRPAEAKKPTVVLVEGEKKALVLQTHFARQAEERGSEHPTALALSWRGGSSAWNKCRDWSRLKGHDVVLWPDNDDPGRKCMAGIARHLKPIAKRLWVVGTLGVPELEPRDDVVDVIGRGHSPVQWIHDNARRVEYREPQRAEVAYEGVSHA